MTVRQSPTTINLKNNLIPRFPPIESDTVETGSHFDIGDSIALMYTNIFGVVRLFIYLFAVLFEINFSFRDETRSKRGETHYGHF